MKKLITVILSLVIVVAGAESEPGLPRTIIHLESHTHTKAAVGKSHFRGTRRLVLVALLRMIMLSSRRRNNATLPNFCSVATVSTLEGSLESGAESFESIR
ncbi:MAG: hypothetical protein R2883_00370 [Caldisericia bacterium]